MYSAAHHLIVGVTASVAYNLSMYQDASAQQQLRSTFAQQFQAPEVDVEVSVQAAGATSARLTYDAQLWSDGDLDRVQRLVQDGLESIARSSITLGIIALDLPNISTSDFLVPGNITSVQEIYTVRRDERGSAAVGRMTQA